MTNMGIFSESSFGAGIEERHIVVEVHQAL
jgi:hypothetical protein